MESEGAKEEGGERGCEGWRKWGLDLEEAADRLPRAVGAVAEVCGNRIHPPKEMFWNVQDIPEDRWCCGTVCVFLGAWRCIGAGEGGRYPLPRARGTRPKTRRGRFGRGWSFVSCSSRGDATMRLGDQWSVPVRLGVGGLLMRCPVRQCGHVPEGGKRGGGRPGPQAQAHTATVLTRGLPVPGCGGGGESPATDITPGNEVQWTSPPPPAPKEVAWLSRHAPHA